MAESQSQISNDPGWMLQSEKISDADLARALTKSYYLEILHLCSTLLIEEKAEQAARETIVDSVRDRTRFWGTASLRVWLLSRAVRTCSKPVHVFARCTIRKQRGERDSFFSTLSKPDQRLLLLRYGIGMGADEIAILVKKPEEKVRQRLKFLRSKTAPWQGSALPVESEMHLTARELERQADGLTGNGKPAEHEEHIRTCSDCRTYAEMLKRSDDTLRRAVEEFYPRPVRTGEQVNEAARVITGSALQSGEKILVSLRLKEIGLVLGAVVLVGIVIFSGQLLAPYEPLIEKEIVVIKITATPRPGGGEDLLVGNGTAAEDRLSTLEPLKMTSTVGEILERIQRSADYWEQLWVEGVMFDYGPVGYVGPPQVYYNRVWIRGADSVLVMGGQRESPDYLLMYTGNSYSERAMGKTFHFSLSGKDASPLHRHTPLSLAENPSNRGRLFGYYLHDLLYPGGSELASSLYQGESSDQTGEQGDERPAAMVTGLEYVHGREAVILRSESPDGSHTQISVDTKSGMILRWREYSASIQSQILWEIALTSVRYDPGIPDFHPSIRQVNQDIGWVDLWIPEESGRRPPRLIVPSEKRLPYYAFQGANLPEGSDPAKESLAFVFQILPEPDDPETWNATIFADRFPLLTFPVGVPWNLTCTRSPDGSWISLAQEPNEVALETGSLYWINLRNPGITVRAAGTRFGLGAAFSPDSRYLVYSATTWDDSTRGVHLYDLATYQVRKLMDVPFSAHFIWKADGAQVGFIGGERTTDLNQWVLDVATGEILFQAKASIHNLELDPQSPAASWGVQFPPEYGGIDACVEP